MHRSVNNDVLVSVVIPCFNHGEYLAEAIESAQAQTHGRIELIVVDDGSTDNTADVVARYSSAHYLKQRNQGLSAARNRGLLAATGNFIMFTDADDRMLPRAVEANLACLQRRPEASFVSGGYRRISVDGRFLSEPTPTTDVSQAYERLLRGNYIGMHGTVMYRRDVLLEVGMFDVSLSACEDYDLYLRICHAHQVAAHPEIIAEYRTYSTSLSADRVKMLMSLRRVRRRQDENIRQSSALQQLALEGRDYWFTHYGVPLVEDSVNSLFRGGVVAAFRGLAVATRFAPRLAVRTIGSVIAQNVSPAPLSRLRAQLAGKTYYPGVGKVRFGDLRRTCPISYDFGFDRGLPVDRYYVEQFMSRHASSISGRVLELGDNAYTIRFGGARVTQSDVLDLLEDNPAANLAGDLADGDHLPAETFDCVIVTQALHLIFDAHRALTTLHRMLKPGGALLLTVPGISSISYDKWSEQWFWSFTDQSIRRLLEGSFPNAECEVTSFGNVLAATAFLQGIAANELSPAELDSHDEKYQCIIAAHVVKEIAGDQG